MSSGRRRNIRLPKYDYSDPGIYYVTISLRERRPLFGSVTNHGVEPSSAGAMISRLWTSLPERFPCIAIDQYVVMPDHIIGLLVFGSDPLQGAQVTLGTVIGAFKSLTTLEFGKGVRDSGWLRFESKLWLENYYERVVRNDGELEQIRNYITANPSRWWEKYGDGHPQGV